jgi:hypothetical protein
VGLGEEVCKDVSRVPGVVWVICHGVVGIFRLGNES